MCTYDPTSTFNRFFLIAQRKIRYFQIAQFYNHAQYIYRMLKNRERNLVTRLPCYSNPKCLDSFSMHCTHKKVINISTCSKMTVLKVTFNAASS